MTMSSKGQVRRDYHHQQEQEQCHHTREGLDLQGGIIVIDSRHRQFLVGFNNHRHFVREFFRLCHTNWSLVVCVYRTLL